MTKRPGTISDNGFRFRKMIKRDDIKKKREKKSSVAVLERIKLINFYPIGKALGWSQAEALHE